MKTTRLVLALAALLAAPFASAEMLYWMPAISAPEPTSGLLFLCGWAALLLRRRRESL